MTKPEAPKVPVHGPGWQEGMVGPPDTAEGQALYSEGSDMLTRHFSATHRFPFVVKVLMERAKLKHWSRPQTAEALAKANPAGGAYKDYLQVLCEIDEVEYVYEPPPSSLKRRFTDAEIIAAPMGTAKAMLAQSDGPLAGALKDSL
jgi:hypothetical protein